MNYIKLTTLFFIALSFSNCNSQNASNLHETESKVLQEGLSKAYFASGCFWCVEIIYESVRGVEEVISGYAGGHTKNPTYRQVGSETTGHAEAVEVYYDADIISFETLVQVYYASQNPTTVGQHPDYGDAYRSIIFYQDDSEKEIAETYKTQISEDYKDAIVTEIIPFEIFWNGEDYHQDYERKNPNQPYVRGISIPRLRKFQAKHPELLKD